MSVHWTNGRSALQATRPTSKASGILFLANTVLGGQVDGCGGEFDDSGSIRCTPILHLSYRRSSVCRKECKI
ncbi:MAG: hypothetical protein KDA47_14785, partial [Planctomycetales bacterium]|nr:hypothetical protein [Planctomycetales bacterium]